MIDLTKVTKGDRVTFRALTRHSNEIATRDVWNVYPDKDMISVRYQGYQNFYVYNHEIIEITKKEK